MLIEVKDAKEFKEIISKPNLSVVHFSAKWAEQCQQINELLDELSKQEDFKSNNVQFCFCEAEDLAEISLQYKIEAAPTVLLFRNGQVVTRVDGADTTQLTTKIKQHHKVQTITSSKASTPDESLEARLKKLINQHKVMVFMKGNRENPRCGFSKQLIQMMEEIGAEYGTFDILQDEEVRQGLKVFSDWPTYPQLYVKGELIGGLDIAKEMKASGDLLGILKG